MKEIPLTKGYAAIVDDEDFGLLMQFKWYARVGCKIYAQRRLGRATKGRPTFKMHRFILGAQEGQLVDHRNGNGLDNRRENLRIATKSENNWNRRKTTYINGKPTDSVFKGVIRNRQNKTKIWQANIMKDLRNIYIGVFATEIEAARAYDRKAKELFGEFAQLNFPNEVVH